jgi:hypothetical protein
MNLKRTLILGTGIGGASSFFLVLSIISPVGIPKTGAILVPFAILTTLDFLEWRNIR